MLMHLFEGRIEKYDDVVKQMYGDAPVFFRQSDKSFYLMPTSVGSGGEITSYEGYPKHWRINYLIVNNSEDDDIGTLGLGITEDDQVLRLIDIKISPKFRKQGYAERVLGILVAMAPNNVLIINDIKKSAIPFWDHMDVEYFTDAHKDQSMISAKLTH
jgi:hypothetical protein